ncbi:universal stress protein [Tamlana crocina]
MDGNKNKILVLSDLKDSTEAILKSAIALAKILSADIKFFHVKKGTDVVDRDSQLSSFRTINEQHSLTKNSIDGIIKSVSKTYGLKIDYSYAFGNIKNEIQDQLDTYQPDVVIVGRRKSRLGLAGDKIINFVLKAHEGPVLVVNSKNTIEPDKALFMAILNGRASGYSDAITNSLLEQTQKPLKLFEVVDKAGKHKGNEASSANGDVEFVFERNDNTVSNLSKYLLKSNINLLYLNRKSKEQNNDGLKKSDIKDIISKIEVSMLISG